MKLLKKYFKNEEKLNANEIAICTDNENNKYQVLDKYLDNLIEKVVFTGSTSNIDSITFEKEITGAKFIEIEYGNANYGDGLKSERFYNPVGKKIRLETVWHNSQTNMIYSSYSLYDVSKSGMSLSTATGVAVGGNNAYGVTGKTIYINKVIAYF